MANIDISLVPFLFPVERRGEGDDNGDKSRRARAYRNGKTRKHKLRLTFCSKESAAAKQTAVTSSPPPNIKYGISDTGRNSTISSNNSRIA